MKEFLVFIFSNYRFYLYLAPCVIFFILSFLFFIRKHVEDDNVLFSVEVISDLALALSAAVLLKHHGPDSIEFMPHPFVAGFALKVVCAIACGLMIPLFVHSIAGLVRRFTGSGFYRDNLFGIAVFLYLSVEMAERMRRGIDNWVSQWYAVNYSMGIGSRFFIGSLLSVFSPDYIHEGFAYGLCIVTCFAIVLLCTFILNRVIKSVSGDRRAALLYLIVLYLASPGSITAVPGNIGRLEIFGLLMALLGIVIFEKLDNIWLRYALLTLMSCLSMAIYQGNIFMYYPLMLVPVVCACFRGEGKLSRRDLFLGIGNIVLTSAAFLFFQFCSFTYFTSAEEMTEALRARTNLDVTKNAIDYELFKPVSYAFKTLNIGFLKGSELPREQTVLTFIILMPVMVLIFAVYRKCVLFYRRKGVRLSNCAIFYFPILALSILPQYILNVDWGRWMLSTGILVFFQFIYLVEIKDPAILEALDSVFSFIKRHRVLAVFCMVYIAGLGRFRGREFLSAATRIAERLVKYGIVSY